MNPELKAKWIAALRSDKYQQGENCLRRGNEFCCLGVLCDVAGIPWKLTSPNEPYKTPLGTTYLDYCEDDNKNNPENDPLGLPKRIHDKAYNLNDGTGGESCATFIEIANWLESEEF